MDFTPIKTINVLGEPVDILTNGDMTDGLSTTVLQTSPPGGGPPPHSHQNEDETFFVLEGTYEFLLDGVWHMAPQGSTVHAVRGSVHGFRNAGATSGKLLIFVAPAGFENYLEEISVLTLPEEMAQLIAISERYGIKFAV
jgi:mannose-6-phosphate isomerase-like protein (cupin superfamily)